MTRGLKIKLILFLPLLALACAIENLITGKPLNIGTVLWIAAVLLLLSWWIKFPDKKNQP